MTELKLILAGLGGQGVVFITRLFAQAAISSGQAIMVSETHGMSQRGGSVVSHLRISGSQTPLIRRGTADILISLDAHEAIRNLPFLRRGGTAFVNSSEKLRPELDKHLKQLNIRVHSISANQLAMELKFPAVANVILVGFVAAYPVMPFPIETLQEAIRIVAKRGLDINLEAFHIGYQAGQALFQENPVSSTGEKVR